MIPMDKFIRLTAVAAPYEPENVDTVHDWQRWAAEGPTCTCTHGADGAIAVQHFDCPVHGNTVYRNQIRNRLVAA